MSSKQQRGAAPKTKARQSAKTKSADVAKARGRTSAPRSKGAAQGDPEAASRGTALTARAGTKQALVIELLNRPTGASLNDLVSATGWLPHTTRAALTGLRQKGFTLEKSKGADGQTSYRIDPVRSTGAAKEAAA